MIDSWESWYAYAKENYHQIKQQMHYYEDKNLPLTRNMAAEMGVEFTPAEIKSIVNLIKSTIEMIEDEERYTKDE
jgi:hypothetical protein